MSASVDAFGNYVVNLPPQPASSASGLGLTLFGDGAPTSNPRAFDAVYVDETNGVAYISSGGVWVIASASNVTPVSSVKTWDGTGAMPVQVGPGICIGEDGSAVEGYLWKKTSAGTNNTDWIGM